MPSPQEIRQEITEHIITAIEKGVMPWRRPWRQSRNFGRPANITSRNAYSGVNPWLLNLHQDAHGFSSRWYGTIEQWNRLGGRVQKRPDHVEPGTWGARIVFYRPVKKSAVDDHTGEEIEDVFHVLKTYTIFNADQVDGPAIERLKSRCTNPEPVLPPNFEPASQLITATKADIRHHGDQAYYRQPTPLGSFPNHLDGDFVVLPDPSLFDQPGGYYETAFHEMAHWSEVRLGEIKNRDYAACELVAEMTSCLLSAELGIPGGEGIGNHAAYLEHWLKAMRQDTSFVFKVSTQASKVVDFLLSFVRVAQEEPQNDAA